MIEKLKVDSTTVGIGTILDTLAQYAYAQKSFIGTDYALMLFMTG